jgi:hypothetical protein
MQIEFEDHPTDPDKVVLRKRPHVFPKDEVMWGVDWGRVGDASCVSIIKRLPDGRIEVVAVEYGPSLPSWIEVEQVKWENDKLIAKRKTSHA